ncbi:MAG: ABC transporter ATP-binding protein [Gemmataceae bacterium]|nr:ABC transporter ATP-binding protein [Gemmataceae bacterium]
MNPVVKPSSNHATHFLAIDQVNKAFARRGGFVHAVRQVSLKVSPSEVVGLVGPNRAGKSTLLKLALGLLTPDSGSVALFGLPPRERQGLKKTGAMLESPLFPSYLKLRDLFFILGGLGAEADLTPEDLPGRVENVLARVGMGDRAADRLGTFSRGMTQRVLLAQALLQQPEFLILDEPTEGMDLDGVEILKKEIESLRQRGGSALLASHALEEVESLCDRVALVQDGRLQWLDPGEFDGRRRGWLRKALQEIPKEMPGGNS